MKLIYTTALALGLYSSGALTQDAAENPSMDCEQAVTVFHDISSFGRKDRAAEKMTERHEEMALSHWRYAGMVIYTENGDLEGFFVSYTRPASCPAE